MKVIHLGSIYSSNPHKLSHIYFSNTNDCITNPIFTWQRGKDYVFKPVAELQTPVYKWPVDLRTVFHVFHSEYMMRYGSFILHFTLHLQNFDKNLEKCQCYILSLEKRNLLLVSQLCICLQNMEMRCWKKVYKNCNIWFLCWIGYKMTF